MAERVGEALLPLGQPGQAAEDSRLADLVADRLEQREGVVETRVGLDEAAGPGVPEGEAVQGVRLPGHIVRPAGGVQPGALRPGVVLPGPAAQEEGAEGPRELPGVGSKPAWPASRTAASSPACSALNQSTASSAVAGWLRDDPGRGGLSVSGSKCGSISIAAWWAVCR